MYHHLQEYPIKTEGVYPKELLAAMDHVKRSVKRWPRSHKVNIIHQYMGYNTNIRIYVQFQDDLIKSV